MANARTYMRKFIILDSFSKYTVKKPKGYAKLEIRNGKGKLLVNIEGLKGLNEEDSIFEVCLISEKEKIMKTDAGIIKINENGRGNLEWPFDPESIGRIGAPIEDFNIILVNLHREEAVDSKIDINLAGYIHKDDDSIEGILKEFAKNDTLEVKDDVKEKIQADNQQIEQVEQNEEDTKELEEKFSDSQEFVKFQETQEIKEIEDIKEQEEQEEQIQAQGQEEQQEEVKESTKILDKEPKIEIIKENEPVIQKGNIENASEDNNYPESNTYEKNKEDEFPKVEDTSEYFTKGDDNSQNNDDKNPKSYEEKYSVNMDNYFGYPLNNSYNFTQHAKIYRDQIFEYTTNILNFFSKVDPLNEKLKGYTWWKIDYNPRDNYRGFLPFYNYTLNMHHQHPSMYQATTCHKLIKKYSHYLFGIVKDGKDLKYYVYGIPGKFTREEQPYKGMTGFTTWSERKGRNREKLGYWLLHIDALNGKLVNPFE